MLGLPRLLSELIGILEGVASVDAVDMMLFCMVRQPIKGMVSKPTYPDARLRASR